MSLDAGPISSPAGPASRADPHIRLTLARCRERLRAAVGLLSSGQPGQAGQAGQSTLAHDGRHAEARRDPPSPEVLREFRVAEQAYDELVASIGHEVKTSLTIIRGHAQLTARGLRRGDPPDRDAILAAMSQIDASTIRLVRELDSLIEDP